jgi:hypothetical protein
VRRFPAALASVLAAAAVAAGAQTGGTAASPSCCTIAADTPVRIAVVEPVSSRSSRTGERFAIRLAEPIVVDGHVLVPAGAPGVGEVVHAQQRGGFSRPGELILAARYIAHGEVRIPLHKLRFAMSGADGTTRWVVGYPATYMTVSGVGHVDVAAGTILQARVAAPVTVPAID